MLSIRIQLHFFISTARRTRCSSQMCKSRLQALSVLTVCWETLVLQNPTLMVFHMRPYICGVKVLVEGMRVRFSVGFHYTALVVKGLRARGFPDWEGGFFYGPKRSELYESDRGPSVLWLPAEISCLFISGENLFCWFIGWHSCNGWRNSIFSLFIRFIFPPVEEQSLVWYHGKTSFLLAPVPWEMRLERGRETGDRGQGT